MDRTGPCRVRSPVDPAFYGAGLLWTSGATVDGALDAGDLGIPVEKQKFSDKYRLMRYSGEHTMRGRPHCPRAGLR